MPSSGSLPRKWGATKHSLAATEASSTLCSDQSRETSSIHPIQSTLVKTNFCKTHQSMVLENKPQGFFPAHVLA